jgi:glycosyltransferase involved in cell wall biosynthesis
MRIAVLSSYSEINNKTMKITVIIPSFSGGGAERVGVNLANYYSNQGHSVTIIVTQKLSGPYLRQVSENIQVIDFKSFSKITFIKALIVLLRLYFELRKEQPDIILSILRDSNIYAGLAAVFLDSRVILSEQNTFDSIVLLPYFSKIKRLLLMRISYWRADKIIANSHDVRSDLLLYKIGKPECIEVIGNPVLAKDFEGLLEEGVNHPWLTQKISNKIILNVGRLHKQKNQTLLIYAFEKVYQNNKNVKLIILGEGAKHKDLIDLVQRLSLTESVCILPFQQNPYPFYKLADVFVLSSAWEGFGNVLVEAMASETPVISTDCPGGPCMILQDGQFGRLVAPDSVDQLAEAIIEELNSPTSPQQIEKAKKRALDFSVPTIAEAYLA